MKELKRLAHVYNKLEEYALVYTLAFCVVIISFQVIMRYVFNNSLSWTEEAAKYLFIWLIWLGTSIAAKERSHISLEIVTNKLKGRAKAVLDIVAKLIWVAMCLFLLVNGLEVVQGMIGRGKTASAMPWLKVWVVYLAIPVSQGVLSLRIIVQIIEDIKQIFRPGKGTDEPLAELKGGADL